MSKRVERVQEELKYQISKVIQEDLKDPRLGFISLTKVIMPADLKSARVYFSVLGDEKEIKSSTIALNHAVGFVKKLIAERMRLKFTPDLEFFYDDSIAYSQHISDVIEKLKKDEKM